ncbi:Heat shock 70 kDa protein 12A [Pelomyxa schiedti]|nr:Heat shock 70 kDa protein 12A [Pelomyxa schiedti]
MDFGTSYTGFAFRDRRKGPHSRAVMSDWASCQLPKTPTEVVLDVAPPHALIKFGHDARVYMRNLDDEVSMKCLHFKGPKMLLYERSNRSEVFSTNQPRVSVTLKHLVTCILGHLVEKALAQMNRDFPTRIEEVKWVLTVPAIWDQCSRAFMEECATRAGINNVILALEPEAASVAMKDKLRFSVGTKYILVDAGGGTVDITVHETISDTTIVELLRPSGGPWGSTNVNSHFFKLMEDVFGDDVIAMAKEDASVFDLEDAIESMKLNLCEEVPKINISMYCIARCLKQMSKPPIPQMINNFNTSHPTMVNAKGEPLLSPLQDHGIRIDASLMKSKIKQLATETSNHIKDNLLPSLSGVTDVYLVGGLAKCPYYYDTMVTLLPGQLSVHLPNDPLVAVLEGAVIAGEKAQCVKKRCVPYTYAVSTTDLAPRHPGRPTFLVDGQRRCHVLQTLVRSGDLVDTESEVSLAFSPINPDQDRITFDIFKSKKTNVEYPDDPGVELVKAGLQVNNLPGVGLPVQQRPRVTLKFKFASTIITAQAVCPGFPPVVAKWNEGLTANPGPQATAHAVGLRPTAEVTFQQPKPPPTNWLCCCAIEFGLISAGFAFRDKRKGNPRVVMAEWNTQLQFPTTPIEAVMDAAPPHALLKFGQEARTFMQNADSKVSGNALYFKDLGHLCDGKTEVFSTNQPRVSVPLKHLVTCILSHLAQKALAQMRRDFPTEMDDVKWIITTPAIWNQSVRDFMQECSLKAGIVGGVIISDSEAASVAVKTHFNIPIGGMYMVADLRGPTASITVHKCLGDSVIADIYAPSVGPWGATLINNYFFQLMTDIFGDDVLAKAKEDPGMSDLEEEIEVAKLTLSDSVPKVNIPMDCIVSTLLQMAKPPFTQVVNNFSASNPKMVDSTGAPLICTFKHKLRIDTSLIKSKIEALAAEMSNHIDAKLLPSLPGVKVVYLVGGSECERYRIAMAIKLAGKLEIVSQLPLTLVLEGAVLHGERSWSVKKEYPTPHITTIPERIPMHTVSICTRHVLKEGPSPEKDRPKNMEELTQILAREKLEKDKMEHAFDDLKKDHEKIKIELARLKAQHNDQSLNLPLFTNASLFVLSSPHLERSMESAIFSALPTPCGPHQIDLYKLVSTQKEYTGKISVTQPEYIYREVLTTNLYRALGVKAAKATLSRFNIASPISRDVSEPRFASMTKKVTPFYALGTEFVQKLMLQNTRTTPVTITAPYRGYLQLPQLTVEGLWKLAAVAKWFGDTNFLGCSGDSAGFKVIMRNQRTGDIESVASIKKIFSNSSGGEITPQSHPTKGFQMKDITFGSDNQYIPFRSLCSLERDEFLSTVREIIQMSEGDITSLVLTKACLIPVTTANTPGEIIAVKEVVDRSVIASLISRQQELREIYHDELFKDQILVTRSIIPNLASPNPPPQKTSANTRVRPLPPIPLPPVSLFTLKPETSHETSVTDSKRTQPETPAINNTSPSSTSKRNDDEKSSRQSVVLSFSMSPAPKFSQIELGHSPIWPQPASQFSLSGYRPQIAAPCQDNSLGVMLQPYVSLASAKKLDVDSLPPAPFPLPVEMWRHQSYDDIALLWENLRNDMINVALDVLPSMGLCSPTEKAQFVKRIWDFFHNKTVTLLEQQQKGQSPEGDIVQASVVSFTSQLRGLNTQDTSVMGDLCELILNLCFCTVGRDGFWLTYPQVGDTYNSQEMEPFLFDQGTAGTVALCVIPEVHCAPRGSVPALVLLECSTAFAVEPENSRVQPAQKHGDPSTLQVASAAPQSAQTDCPRAPTDRHRHYHYHDRDHDHGHHRHRHGHGHEHGSKERVGAEDRHGNSRKHQGHNQHRRGHRKEPTCLSSRCSYSSRSVRVPVHKHIKKPLPRQHRRRTRGLWYHVTPVAPHEVDLRHSALINIFVNFVVDDLDDMEKDCRKQAHFCRKMWNLCTSVGLDTARHSTSNQPYTSSTATSTSTSDKHKEQEEPLGQEQLETLSHRVLSDLHLPITKQRTQLCAAMISLCVQVYISTDMFSFWEPSEGTVLPAVAPFDVEVFPSQSWDETRRLGVDFHVIPGLCFQGNNRKTKPIVFVKYL